MGSGPPLPHQPLLQVWGAHLLAQPMAGVRLCRLRGAGQGGLVVGVLCLAVGVGTCLAIRVVVVAVGVAVTGQVARGCPAWWVQQVQAVLQSHVHLWGGDEGDLGPWAWRGRTRSPTGPWHRYPPAPLQG